MPSPPVRADGTWWWYRWLKCVRMTRCAPIFWPTAIASGIVQCCFSKASCGRNDRHEEEASKQMKKHETRETKKRDREGEKRGGGRATGVRDRGGGAVGVGCMGVWMGGRLVMGGR